MLARHSMSYVASRGVPALINFATIAIFSRMLSPSEYGRYAIALAWMLLASTLAFDWIRLSTLRLFAAHETRESSFLSAVYTSFLGVASLIGIIGASVIMLIPISIDWQLIALVLVLSALHAFHELSSELARARLQPFEYGKLALIRSTGALLFGGAFVSMGMGGDGALLGLAVSLMLSTMYSHSQQWGTVTPTRREGGTIVDLARYGWPLTISLFLHYVMSMSDRLMIERLLDPAAAGLYAVAYDLPRQSLGTLMMIVTLAGLPLAVRCMEHDGVGAAARQLSKNASLLMAIALPAAVGLSMLAEPISNVVVGVEFSATAAALIPWISAGVLLHGLKSYYVDHAFMLSRRVGLQAVAAGIGAVTNVGLNIVLIPLLGLPGAAYATVTAYAIALLTSLALVRSLFPIRFPADASRIALATIAMATVLYFALPIEGGVVELALHVLLGALAFGISAVALNVAGLRLTTITAMRPALAMLRRTS